MIVDPSSIFLTFFCAVLKKVPKNQVDRLIAISLSISLSSYIFVKIGMGFKFQNLSIQELEIMRDINRELIDTCLSTKEKLIKERNKAQKDSLTKLNKNILAMENEIKRIIKINLEIDIAFRKKHGLR